VTSCCGGALAVEIRRFALIISIHYCISSINSARSTKNIDLFINMENILLAVNSIAILLYYDSAYGNYIFLVSVFFGCITMDYGMYFWWYVLEKHFAIFLLITVF